ncbi:hypothetical protein [Ktedonospora formicarum]|uniref:Uncharacterized protein n=1 Tax=Ktedonospora formicarum TaxID=2778364 RepID=A0A8J3I3D8_9CHLR|nr:hypothetical protein [Ktedonospora formicarum]GHO46846.1 hypothetical protein KSX_50090 [Ktedonospora formicarum]
MSQKKRTYQVAFCRSINFRDVFGNVTPLSSGEILCGVELRARIPATRNTPARYELAATLDGKPRVLSVQQQLVELMEESDEQARHLG